MSEPANKAPRSPRTPSINDVFSQLVFELRRARGLSQHQFAKLICMPRTNLMRIERGCGQVRPVHLQKIFLMLDLPITRLPRLLAAVMEEYCQPQPEIVTAQPPKEGGDDAE